MALNYPNAKQCKMVIINGEGNITIAKSEHFSEKYETPNTSSSEISFSNSNTGSIDISSIDSLDQSAAKREPHQNVETTHPLQYKCNLKKFRAIHQSEKLRPPMQSSMDWINRLSESATSNESFASSIINLSDCNDDDSSK